VVEIRRSGEVRAPSIRCLLPIGEATRMIAGWLVGPLRVDLREGHDVHSVTTPDALL
jgi:hypothetical protein